MTRLGYDECSEVLGGSMLAGSAYVEGNLIDRIYEASVVPELWPEVLRLFVAVAECKEGALIATDGENYKWVGSSAKAEQLAVDHYSFEGGAERSRRLMRENRPGFVSDFDVFSDEEMSTFPLFRDFLIPAGYGRGIATAIRVPSGETIIVDAEGDIRLGRFHHETINRLDALRPHLARSAMVSARLAFERARTAVETLAAIGFAACAVSASGKVVVANSQFEASAGQLTTRAGDRIALRDARADKQLSSVLQTARATPAVGSVALAGSESTPPAVLHILPIRRSANDLFAHAAALLVLTTATKTAASEPRLLQALFDLTPAEAAVAVELTAGQTLQGIAAKEAKSIETVRNQLKSVMAKTGCRRQIDLVKLLTQLALSSPNATETAATPS